MLGMMKRLYLFVLSTFQKAPTPVVATPAPSTRRASMDESSGEFYFREAILDQLDYYTKCIVRMRSTDPEAFALYAELGANVVPEAALRAFGGIGAHKHKHQTPRLSRPPLSPWFAQTLPAFGAIFCGKVARDAEKRLNNDVCVPRFFYFRKYDRLRAPPGIERPTAGTVYVATVYWDNLESHSSGLSRWHPKAGIPQDYPLVIYPDGTIHLLRTLTSDTVTIRHKRGAQRGKSSVHRQQWIRGGCWFSQWASEYNMDVEDYLVTIFTAVANMYEVANTSVIRVSATKGALSATFGVDIKRTPYFFKDREVRLGNTGRRKRIFHIVRPHVRKSGKAVKFHFRGERSFEWNGYRIAITVPGKHHHHLTEFNIGALDADRVLPGTVTTAGVASAWKHHISGDALSFRKAS